MFLGAGCYNHYVPAVVRTIISRSEFFTSYTQYQPELSQGFLRALFEYQTFICQLTGMDVSNVSLYDWAASLGEAALMSARIKKEYVRDMPGRLVGETHDAEGRQGFVLTLQTREQHIREFVAVSEDDPEVINKKLLKEGITGGLSLRKWD